MDTAQLAAALERVLAEHPELSLYGYGYPQRRWGVNIDHEDKRACLRLSLQQIRRSMAYLESMPRLGPRSRRWRNSYNLKHAVENTAPGGYVANGSLIAAALILGIPIRVSPDSPNPSIAVGVA